MTPYDPLNYENLARSVIQALMERAPTPFLPMESFKDCGVYAIYYHGDFPAYGPVVAKKCPIYVGKADLPGSRKGTGDPAPAGTALFRRLQEHARSIQSAEDLPLADFRCRYLVVIPVWVTLAERFLISYHQPIWRGTSALLQGAARSGNLSNMEDIP